jgi:diguanylate cyclase (GGDEF)-like protein
LNNGDIFLGTGKNKNSKIQNALSQWIKRQTTSGNSLGAENLKTIYQKSEFIRIKENNLNLLAFHRPVGFNNWNLLLTVPDSTFKSSFGIFNNRHLDILSVVIILCGALFYQFYIRNQKHSNQIAEITFVDWLTKGNTLVKFKLLAKDYLKKKKKGTKDVICVIDIKDFRLINERYGHHEGDQILKLTYQAINKVIGDNGIICRGHIDRYFILTAYEDEETLKSYGKEIKVALDKLLLDAHISYHVDLISGVYVINEFEINLDDLLEKANFALRYSKENKELFTILYDDEITQQEIAKMQLEEDLQRALDHNEFHVYLQPKFDLQNNSIIGAEALCRWITPDGKMIPPIQFIPVLEKNKKISTLDLYMFESVCRMQRDWLNQDIKVIPISVNQSKVLIFRNDYVDTIQEIAQRYDIQPHLISIELTETMVFEEVDKLKNLVDSLRDIGFSVSIDDFGTGYSSLNLLKDIHVDTVKIDKSFMGDIKGLKQNILLTSVIQLIKRLGMVALVEGVEKEDQLAFLKEVGADVCQGYIYDAPIPVNLFFDKYLREKQLCELVVN